MNFFNKKKAFMGLSLSQMVGIILVILIFIPFTGLFAKTFNTFFGGEEPSIENFDSLTEKIQELILNTERVAIETNYPYFIRDNDYILVGFDHEWHGNGTDSTEDNTPYGPFEANLCHDEGIRRPMECLGKACLCIYEDTVANDFMEGGDPAPTKCFPFGNNIFFSSAEGYPNYLEDKDGVNDGYKKEFIKKTINFTNLTSLDYEFFVIYGECGNSGCKLYENNKCEEEFDEFDARKLYIEKYYDLDSHKTHILIAVQEGNINQRAESAQKLIEELRKSDQATAQQPSTDIPVADSAIDYEQQEQDIGLTLINIESDDVSCAGQCKLTQEAYTQIIEANNIAKQRGKELHIYSSYRSLQQQIDIWEASNRPLNERGTYICNPHPTDTAPTRCPHLTGGAVDLRFKDKSFDAMTTADWQQLEDIMYQAGWVRYENEEWHFEYNTNRWARADTDKDGMPNQPTLV